jgi:ABC-type uncharacterized transport system YnjBCD substrate-binding protein
VYDKDMSTMTSNQTLSEEAKQNLEKNAELWKAESVYVKLEDGETRILQFNPERIKHVEGQYGIRIQYLVIDPNYADKGDKKFEAGKSTSRDIDAQLRQGNRLLKIKRLGLGTDTKYSVSPT